MKRLIIGYLICLGLPAFMTSCTKPAESEPRELITENLIWDTQDRNAFYARQFLNNVYNFIPTGFTRVGGDFLDAGTDDAIPSRNNSGFASVDYYTNGLLTPAANPDAYWSNSYAGIRQANIFLNNIDLIPKDLPTIVASIRNWKAEVRFIRAYLYFELLKRYGGVPLIGDRVLTLQDNLQIPRNTFTEVFDYIINECDASRSDLLLDGAVTNGVPDVEWGRISRAAPMALKCRMYLYAASPLWNGGAPAGSQKNAGLLGYLTNDPNRWQRVITMADSIRNLNFFTLQSSFLNLFVTRRNTEIIFSKQLALNNDLENNNGPVGYTVTNVRGGGRTSPTQNLVDAFPMSNGLLIGETGSGYNPANPYIGRDNRFGATIFFNGSRWLGDTVRTFEGGKDKPNTGITQTKTGYYARKFMYDASNNTSYSAQSHNFIIFRYAEILLNLAEALNEVGRTEDAVNQIKLIRARAGIAAGANTRYGMKAGITQTEMRTLIQNERRVELAFEEHRFWDVRRWRLGSQLFNGPLYGMQITRTGTFTYTYQVVPVGNMLFTEKLYYLPIPYDEIIKNSALVQNPNW